MDKSYCPHWELTWYARIPGTSDSIVALVNHDDGGVIKINDMVMGPRMMCNPGAFSRSFHVPFVLFFFPRNKRSACFTNIAP